MRRRRHTTRMVTAALAIFATAFVGGTLQAALSSDLSASGQPAMIHEAGVARFATTDTGVFRAIKPAYARTPLQRFLLKLGFGPKQPLVLTDETAESVRELGVATVTNHDDGSRSLTVQTPSEWVFELRNE